MVTEPRRVLGFVTLAVTAFGAVAAWAWSPQGAFPTATALLAPAAVLSALAIPKDAKRGWLFLVLAWVLGLMAYGAMPDIPADWN